MMINKIFEVLNIMPASVASSKLYSDRNFYTMFIKDLKNSKKSVTIESPFLTKRRLKLLAPTFGALTSGGVKVMVATRHPNDYDDNSYLHAVECINFLKLLGVKVALRSGHFHRKIAIIDDCTLWEGSLNILSQYKV